MSHFRTLLARIAATIACLAVLASCSLFQDHSSDSAVADLAAAMVVTIGRSGQPTIGATAAPVASFVNRVLQSEGQLTVVTADGQPRVVAGPIGTSVSGANDRLRANARQALNTKIAATVAASTPAVAEADPLTALSLAARATSGHSTREVLIVDSGISTAGMVAMQAGIVNVGADVAGFVTALQNAGQLPDLTGVTVKWVGMGTVAAPQPALSNAALSRVRAFWAGVIAAAGGKLMVDETPLAGEPAAAGAPAVTPVGFDDKAPAVPVPLLVSLSTQLRFVANRDVFADEPAAVAALGQVCSQITARGFSTVTVTGTTSDDGSPIAGQISLSQRRADRVGRWLLTSCSPSLHVTSRGVGPNFAGYTPDRDSAGQLIEAQAAKNRLTIIEARA